MNNFPAAIAAIVTAAANRSPSRADTTTTSVAAAPVDTAAVGTDSAKFSASVAAVSAHATASTTNNKTTANTKATATTPTKATATTPSKVSINEKAAAGDPLNATPAPACDWAVEQCHMIGLLPPIKCQRSGCTNYAHHVCSIEWVTKNNLPEGTIGTLCREHHPMYRNPAFIVQPASMATYDASPSMTVSTVTAEAREKSPLISTANKINATTTTKRKINQRGEIVAAMKGKEIRIGKGVRVFSTKAQIKSRVKQGDPQYDVIKTLGAGFRLYGRVIEPDARKGWWVVEYDLFPMDAKSIRVTRGLVTTVRQGEDEPQYHPRNEKIAMAIENIEKLGGECDNDHCDILLVDTPPEYDDNDNDVDNDINGDNPATSNKKKKKISRKVASLQSFLNMSDEGVLDATYFDHYYGEGEKDFIRWEILKEGDEIVEDVMQHPTAESPFAIDIPWTASKSLNDYFRIFFEHFFPSMKGKAAVLDKYLSDERCSCYKYVQHDKIKFHQADEDDPDYLVSRSLLCTCIP